jgi:hypothetical protein
MRQALFSLPFLQEMTGQGHWAADSSIEPVNRKGLVRPYQFVVVRKQQMGLFNNNTRDKADANKLNMLIFFPCIQVVH